LSPGDATKAIEFQKGQLLLAGAFVKGQIIAQVAPRRTVEGGRSLRDIWLRDPVP
jgi:hypothetical protein